MLSRPGVLLPALAAVGALVWFLLSLPAVLKGEDQITNTAILIAFLGFYLVYDFRPKLSPLPRATTGVYLWSLGGTLLCVASFLLPGVLVPVFCLFGGACCFLRSASGALLGPDSQRLLNALFITFTLFGALLVSLPLLDMPLRVITGKWSAHIFEALHHDTALGFIVDDGIPMLLLVVNGRPFHVAAECNGFGLLGTCILLTCAFIAYRRVAVFDAFLLLLVAVFVAVVGNLVRIFIIVSLAPQVGDHYMLMHEIVGTLTFYSFLGLQWWLTIGFGKSPIKAENQTDPRETDDNAG